MLEKIQNVLETDQWTVFGEKSSTIDDFVVLNFDEDSLKKLKALAMCSFFGRERIIFNAIIEVAITGHTHRTILLRIASSWQDPKDYPCR
ncbi:hypothetical protein J6590_084073 [Homalodisca vitripennis]|nr:hypothetical protein J6590_084073 [Homalodisca vitripennis]